MATSTGTIKHIKLHEDYCIIKLEDSGGSTSYLVLWSYNTQEDNAKNRLTHGMWLSLCRDALKDRLEVSVYHDSSLVEQVTLKSP